AAGGAHDRRRDRAAAASVAQGNHGRQEEDDRRAAGPAGRVPARGRIALAPARAERRPHRGRRPRRRARAGPAAQDGSEGDLMADMLAFAESRGGELRSVAFEAVTAARTAADASGGGQVHALVFGVSGIAEAAAESLGRFGADVILSVESEEHANYNAEAIAATAAEQIRAGGYRAAFFSASAQGRDLAPRVAAALGVSL